MINSPLYREDFLSCSYLSCSGDRCGNVRLASTNHKVIYMQTWSPCECRSELECEGLMSKPLMLHRLERTRYSKTQSFKSRVN